MKLHLGCGSKHFDGYINIDIIGNEVVDVLANCTHLPMFENETVDEIISQDFIEHLSREQFDAGKKEWHRLLKPNGKLIIECPDLGILTNAFVNGTEKERWENWGNINIGIVWHIYGNQLGSNDQIRSANTHKWGYTSERLISLLSFGFKNFKVSKSKLSSFHFKLECEKK